MRGFNRRRRIEDAKQLETYLLNHGGQVEGVFDAEVYTPEDASGVSLTQALRGTYFLTALAKQNFRLEIILSPLRRSKF